MSKRGMQSGREQDIRDERLYRFCELAKYRGGHLYQSALYCVFVKSALNMDEMEFVPVV